MSTTTVTAQVAVPPVHVLSSALAPPTKLKTGVKGTLRPGLLTKEDLWSVHGKYYDLNTFVARHPGGVDAILLGKGLDDCTSLFESYHPFTTKPEKVLRQFLYTRALAPSLEKHADTPYMQNRKDLARAEHTVMQQPVVDTIDPFFDWAKTPFYDDCKRVALTHFSPRGNESVEQVHLNIKATTRAWVQHTIGFGVLCWAFVQFLSGSIPALTYFPLVYWIVASDLMHNGSHFAMSPNPIINKISAYIGSLHVQYHLWAVQHVIAHHVHTNIIHMDPDIHHFGMDRKPEFKTPGYRTHHSADVLPKYSWSWRFAMLMQAWVTTFAISFVNVPKYLAEQAMETCKIRAEWLPKIRNDRLVLAAACVLFMWYHGAVYGFWSLFWSWGVHGVCFNVFSQISHSNEASMKGPDRYKTQRGLQKNEWAAHQILTTCDYSCDSWFWGTLSINLNNQAIHHLFPSVHPCHYPALRHKLIPVAKKHGIDYEARSTADFNQTLANYFGWIKTLNESDDGVKQISDSTRVMLTSGTLLVLSAITIPTITVLAPDHPWAPLGGLIAVVFPIIVLLGQENYGEGADHHHD